MTGIGELQMIGLFRLSQGGSTHFRSHFWFHVDQECKPALGANGDMGTSYSMLGTL